MIDFQQIDRARKILELGEDATMEEVKDAYRRLCLKYHPDRCGEKEKKHCEEMMKKVNHAKDVVMMYCAGYRFSFKEKDVKKNVMDREMYEHLKRFYDGWLGDLDL
ncbi:MAG: DnaJ domain-containing protein [Candidatus Omnitrophica bacterium]|nr:DnaJ domain-containing protein [Candidatus Omnitrophota bacterium]